MIDTHCHIDDPQYTDGFDLFIQTQQQAGVERILVPGVNVDNIQAVIDVCKRYPDYLLPAIGLHPEEIKDDYQVALDTLYQSLDMHPYIAIGEIGLDYHFDTTYKQQQQDALRIQLQWAKDRNLPVMIHSRDAIEDTLHILQSVDNLKGVFHCFSGSHESAQQIIKMGFYLGIGGVITFKNCKLADNLHGIPLERIVLETDAPYMAPVPHRGKRNESRWMTFVVDRLAEVYNCSQEYVIQTTNANAKLLFNLK